MIERAVRRTGWLLHAGAIALAAIAWLVPWIVESIEAWDHWSYYLVSVPLITAFSGFAGFVARSRSWRWPVDILLTQIATSLALGGGPGNFFPLGIVSFVAFSIPTFVAAYFGAWLARRLGKVPGS